MADITKCKFCGADCNCYNYINLSQVETEFYCKENCGNYRIETSPMSLEKLDVMIKESKHLIAGYLYEFNRGKDGVLDLCGDNINQLLKDGLMPQTSMQRLERFLVNLYKTDDTIGKHFKTDNIKLSMSYAKNKNEIIWMFRALIELEYMSNNQGSNEYIITPKGFERAEQLLSTQIDSKSVFIAMGFNKDLLEACEKSIKPACAACGFNGHLISDKSHNNGITDEIIVEIKRSKFVIVDFTYGNSGAYFEAGYAQGLGRPVIRCCNKAWFDETKNALHFNTRHYATILWESHEHLLEELKKNIRANIPDAVLND